MTNYQPPATSHQPPATNLAPRTSHLALIVIILFAFFARTYLLDGQSFWSDEGLSLYRAQQTLADIFANTIIVDSVVTQDTNPPFYFLLLHLWRNLVGETPFALRYLGTLFGVLAIPIFYRFTKTLTTSRTALITAGLLAISPFHIWQTQVLRNYSLLITLNLITTYALYHFLFTTNVSHRGSTFLKGGTSQRTGWLILWLIGTALSLYTHYFNFFILASHLTVFVFWVIHQRQWRIWEVGLGVGLTALLALPALFIAIPRFQGERQFDFHTIPFSEVVQHATSAFAVGMSPSLTHPTWRVLPVILVAIIGLVFAWHKHRPVALFLLGYQLIPLGVLLTLSLINPLYNGTRHLLIGLPPFLLFVAYGLADGGRRTEDGWRVPSSVFRLSSIIFGIFIVISQLQWGWTQFHDPALVRDDMRGVANYLSDVVTPDDVIVLHDSIIQFTFNYYYTGAAPVVTVPAYAKKNAELAQERLAELSQSHGRVWLLSEPTPRDGSSPTALTEWADDNMLLFYERRFSAMWLKVNLKAYTERTSLDSIPNEAILTPAGWPNLQLQAFQTNPTIPAGTDWWPTFYFTEVSTEDPLTFSLRLTDDSGQLIAQLNDPYQPPIPDPQSPIPDPLIRYDHRVKVPAGIPPGTYQLHLRLINDTTGNFIPLPSRSADLPLGNITIQPTACNSDPTRWPDHIAQRTLTAPGLTLHGYNFDGQVVAPESYRPGTPLTLNLLWCIRNTPPPLKLQITDPTNTLIYDSPITLPTANRQPPTANRQPLAANGQFLLTSHTITLPNHTLDGDHTIRIIPDSWPFPGRDITTIHIETWPLNTTIPDIPTPYPATFDTIQLLGYHLPAPSNQQPTTSNQLPTTLTLYWQSLANQTSNYVVFVHVVDADGQIVGQGDGIPLYNVRPTTSWRENEVFIDEHTITYPNDLPAGTYQIYIGLFDPQTSQRLPALINGEPQPDNRLLLTTVVSDQ